jgi:mRNA-degrading endonuclease RelE of RelBE toxin-antitoxin system
MPPEEIVWNTHALADLARLDRQVARRVVAAMERYVATGGGNVRRLAGQAPAMYRLRVGGWRVRFIRRVEPRSPVPPEVTPVTVPVLGVPRVRHRREAYDDL